MQIRDFVNEPTSVYHKLFSYFSTNTCCGYQKNGSFEHPNYMLKLMGKNIFTILRSKFCLSKPMLSLLWSIVVDAAATLALGCLCVSFICGEDWTSLLVSCKMFLGLNGKKEESKNGYSESQMVTWHQDHEQYNFDYSLHNQTMENVQSTQYLGITITDDLAWG